MKKTTELFSCFQVMLDNAKEIDNEWERLNKIEKRLTEKLDNIKAEVTGLIKADGLTSIPYEARRVIESQTIQKKHSANTICDFLGISRAYEIKEK
jgi:hypothetical protein